MTPILSLPDEELRRRFLTLQNPRDVADLLEVSYQQYLVYSFYARWNTHYIDFFVPKKSGEMRQIFAPKLPLKIIQQKLNHVLQAVYEIKKPVHGFVKGKSIVSNAAQHIGQHFIFNLDLLDFFPSINFGRVRGLFMAAPYNLPPSVATSLARICCLHNKLPQGAPTSPIISNMICARLDNALFRLAQREGCIYTRYADDITFSTSRLIFPLKIAYPLHHEQRYLWLPGDELIRIIYGNGFGINLEKCRMQTINQHQEITGLTVNEKPNVKRKYVRQIRAMLHAWDKYGLAAAHREYYENYNPKKRGPYKSKPPFKQVVKGKIEFLGMVRGKEDPLYLRFREKFLELSAKRASSVRFMPIPVTDKEEGFDFSKWIDTLPFPLASILWSYNAEDDDEKKYQYLLYFFEALALFMATVLLSGLHNDEELFKNQQMSLSRVFEKNNLSWEKSTFGTWKAVVEKTTKTIRDIRKKGEGDKELATLFKTDDKQILDLLSHVRLSETLQRTNKLRNDWTGHGGVVSDKVAKSRHAEIKNHLDSVIELFGYKWERYKLVCPISFQKRGNTYTGRLENRMGSRTPFKKVKLEFATDLDSEKHYLVAHESRSALELLPLFQIIPSPESAKNACYFYNRLESNGEIRVVSYHFDEKSEATGSFPEISEALKLLKDQ